MRDVQRQRRHQQHQPSYSFPCQVHPWRRQPGSIRLFQLGPAVQSYVKELMEKIEKVEPGRSVTYRVIGGDLRDNNGRRWVTVKVWPAVGLISPEDAQQWPPM
ncbi:unnamed protein product [Linum tenue]|uniref:Uncharacterized protein n=1 Tax=Linum tenue TaxID=586396 RepID=A0AAV0QAC2_9ROSI|nr:unnamed protein product [Linum tenue]